MTHPTDEREAVCANCGGLLSNNPEEQYQGRHNDCRRAATPPTASAPPREDGPTLAQWVDDVTAKLIEIEDNAATVPPPDPAGAAGEETERYRQIALRLNDTVLNGEPVSVNQVRQIARALWGTP